MATGKVKWFNNAKGYGFILPETGGEDLFVHYSSIVMEGYRTLRAGQDVEFEIHEGPKGLHAVEIRTIGEDAAGPDEADIGEAEILVGEASTTQSEAADGDDEGIDEGPQSGPTPIANEVAESR